MRQNCAILLYELVKGYELNVGKVIEESILDYERGKFSGNIPHPSLITLLCIDSFPSRVLINKIYNLIPHTSVA